MVVASTIMCMHIVNPMSAPLADRFSNGSMSIMDPYLPAGYRVNYLVISDSNCFLLHDPVAVSPPAMYAFYLAIPLHIAAQMAGGYS